ncbi:hypothetical protein DICPUDRAFT_37818 [Dictyostelium purpureum]|uniref:Uncharacterized protein n=1 Tax=Dictyostelium purpureum TaxID=5786 RepID=F0ZTH7_DICPU|nr:uncharacterized protein DICPUDRAFT_37818 [Dictyostelium purpureum]EGC32752.1 hypothetical protein DICPUDRAFT_37818 [Dictyostelium purpureum]|eukprot:XP_003290715.1 hypothetical protein DICPUDRAFT_37818 [Dictyostelium purpureum]
MKNSNKILALFILFLNKLSSGQFLRTDTFKSATCNGEPSYSSHLVLLNSCNGNYIYKYVPSDVGGATTAGASTNPVTTAGTLSTVDITSIVTQAVTLGMTSAGSGILTAVAGLNVENLQQNADSVSLEVPTASNTLTTGSIPTSNAAQTTTTSQTIGTPTSNAAQTTTSQTIASQTNSGLLTLGLTTVQGITQAITNVISSSLTTGTNTGNVQTGGGKVVQYYCLSVGCGAQCVSIAEFPLGTCTNLGLDHVIYSITNETQLVTKADNTTSPDSNGFCQSFVTPNSACLTSSPSEITQYKNDFCGKGLKINCTSSKYTSYTCIDSNCDQCQMIKQYDLDKCIIQNSTGTIFKSVLKTNITEPITLPPLSSESTNFSSSDSSNASYLSIYNYSLYLFYLIIISIILL